MTLCVPIFLFCEHPVLVIAFISLMIEDKLSLPVFLRFSASFLGIFIISKYQNVRLLGNLA